MRNLGKVIERNGKGKECENNCKTDEFFFELLEKMKKQLLVIEFHMHS